MQQESSSARSSSIARDWYHLGRVRTLDEVGQLVDALTCESINDYLAEHPPPILPSSRSDRSRYPSPHNPILL